MHAADSTPSDALAASLPRPVGFVLGGGGSLGAQQVGMLQALGDLRVRADLVVGTSIGSVNGAMVAADPIGAASRLSHLWSTVDPDRILGKGLWHRVRTLLRRSNSLYDTPPVADLVTAQIGDGDISHLAVPYAAIAVDVESGMPVRLASGRIATAIEASTAIPAVFPMASRDGRLLCDGGLTTNVAVLDAIEMGARSLVVLDCMFAGHRLEVPRTLPETALWALTTQLRQQVARDVPIAAGQVPVVYLPGSAPRMISPMDFSRTHDLMLDAYRRSRAALETVSVHGPGLYGADIAAGAQRGAETSGGGRPARGDEPGEESLDRRG